MERAPKNHESKEVHTNPNRVFEWGQMPPNSDVLTSPDKVYRQVKEEAITDLNESGVVRNAGSAGIKPMRKYGDRVYWTRGSEGQYHNVQPGHAVYEAPFSIASQRIVRQEDLSSIYIKGNNEKIENLIASKSSSEVENTQAQSPESAAIEQSQLSEVRERLGLPPKENSDD